MSELYSLLKSMEPFTLAFHGDADGIYSASLLMSVFKVKKAVCPPFGEYDTDVAVDLGAPRLIPDWNGVAIDHHPDHPDNRSYKLFTHSKYPHAPCGLIIYEHLREYIPKEHLWKVVGSLTGDGQPEYTPDEIWDLYPILLEERGILTKAGGYRLHTSAFPLFYYLSSGVNAIARLGFPERALEIVNSAKHPLDILDHIEVKDSIERFKAEEAAILKDKPVAETIKNRYIIVRIAPSNSSLNISGYLASKLSSENPGKTVIVINDTTGKISMRGVLAKYVANKLSASGLKAGGHPGYCGCEVAPDQVSRVLEIIRSL